MAWYSGVFDFFKSSGTIEVNGLNDQAPLSLNIASDPLSILTRQNSELPLSKTDRQALDGFAKKLRDSGKTNLRALLKEFYFQLGEKKEMHKALYDLRNNDVVQTIVDVMIDDGLMSSNNNKIFNIKYKGETKTDEIQNAIDKLVLKQKLDQTILDFIDEAIVLGEYILPIEHEEGKGITKLKDNPHMIDMVAVYDGQDKVGFLKLDGKNIEEIEPNNAIHFILSQKKIRVEVTDFAKSDKYFLDEHIKVGKSIILPIINKLKQLEILEMANLALDLKRILAPVLVMVGMPENTQTKDIGAIVEEYEKILGNMFKGLGSMDKVKFNDILSVAGEIKVLPSIGNTKGSISTLDIGSEKDSNQDKSEALRKSIALLIGIPFYYLSLMGENALSRLESLKLFSRYSRKLNAMQDCIVTGVRELLSIHLKDLGFLIDPDDIFIGMRQITNVELLDSMEYLVALVSALQELISVLSSVSTLTDNKISINPEKLMDFLNKLLSEFPDCDQLLVLNDPNNQTDDKTKADDKDKDDKQTDTLDNEFNLSKKFKEVVGKGNLTNENLKDINSILNKLKGL